MRDLKVLCPPVVGRGPCEVDWLDLVYPDALQLDLFVALLELVLDVRSRVLALDQLHQLIGILADYDGPEVTGNVVPGDAVVVGVVEGGQAGFVMVLLHMGERSVTDDEIPEKGKVSSQCVFTCRPSIVTPMSNSVSIGPSERPSWLSGCAFLPL